MNGASYFLYITEIVKMVSITPENPENPQNTEKPDEIEINTNRERLLKDYADIFLRGLPPGNPPPQRYTMRSHCTQTSPRHLGAYSGYPKPNCKSYVPNCNSS
jgi:hypothetical protein